MNALHWLFNGYMLEEIALPAIRLPLLVTALLTLLLQACASTAPVEALQTSLA